MSIVPMIFLFLLKGTFLPIQMNVKLALLQLESFLEHASFVSCHPIGISINFLFTEPTSLQPNSTRSTVSFHRGWLHRCQKTLHKFFWWKFPQPPCCWNGTLKYLSDNSYLIKVLKGSYYYLKGSYDPYT